MDINDPNLNAVWDAWERGESRCPHCIDSDEHFHSNCDCFYHEQVCDIPGCPGK